MKCTAKKIYPLYRYPEEVNKNISIERINEYECDTEMEKIGDVVTAVDMKFIKEDSRRYFEKKEYTSPLYQCPSCKSIKLD